MMRIQIALCAGVALTLASAVWLNRQQTAAHEREQQELRSRLQALEARAPQVERVVERQTRVEVREAAPASTVSADEAENGDNTGVAVPKREPALTTTDLSAIYAAEFQAEPVDANWAHEAAQNYGQAIQANLPASSRVESLECRSRFCDLTVIHPDIATSNGFIQGLFGLEHHGPLLGVTGGFRASEPSITADGKLAYHLYIARPGTPLVADESAAAPAVSD
jgi:hypothetical protein